MVEATNVTHTPTVCINGQDYQLSTPDALLARIKQIVGPVPGIDAPAPSSTPTELTASGLAMRPRRGRGPNLTACATRRPSSSLFADGRRRQVELMSTDFKNDSVVFCDQRKQVAGPVNIPCKRSYSDVAGTNGVRLQYC
jgi:hypothetical protein